MNPAINAKLEALRAQLAEGRPMASAAVTMTGHEMLQAIDSCFYASPPGLAVPSYGRPCKPSALLDGLEKLDFAADDIKVLRAYFDKQAEMELMRTKAQRALQNLRDEGYQGEMGAKVAY